MAKCDCACRRTVFVRTCATAGLAVAATAFSIAVEALRARPDAVIRVRVAGHGIELDNSGRRLAEFAVVTTRP